VSFDGSGCGIWIVTDFVLCLECDSLADGEHRRPREEGQTCECKEGWGGVNCNGTPYLVLSRLFTEASHLLKPPIIILDK
jgi:hypothetical protein